MKKAVILNSSKAGALAEAKNSTLITMDGD